MRLEKIVLNGFKSFADKTEFAFDRPITGIVGPNGCGKSNVVDAIKWVLGEQSVKSLRSGQMADVIFSGSSSRKPLATAEVSLHVSNTMGELPLEADEVEISRRIYRSGESEYRINGKVCRLRDIRELFMDTGVGTKAYSIIEQGQVEQLLTASAQDRRAIFEEAAGISKYKAHKKEALRKLEKTEQNLLRLADIVGEVQKQLRSVKLAAGKARNYLEYTGRLKELQVKFSLAEYDKLTAQLSERRNSLTCVEEQFATIVAEVAQNDALMSGLGNSIIETENEINRADSSLVSVQSRIEQHRQRIEFLRSRMTELEGRKSASAGRIEKLVEQESVFAADIERCRKEQIECQEQVEEKTGAIEGLAQAIHSLNAECASLEAELEDEKSGIIDVVRRTAQLHNEIQSISVYRDNLANQKDRLAGRANTAKAELERLLTAKAQHQARGEDIEKVLAELEQNLESKHNRVDEIDKLIAQENTHLARSKEAKSALGSEMAILRDMENRREGLNNAVKTILAEKARGKFPYVEGILADIFRADVKYAAAVEAALEGKTDALAVGDSGLLLADRAAITELDGRVSFICMDAAEPFADSRDFFAFDGVKGRMAEFIACDGKYGQLAWQLLGKTLLVDSLATAGWLRQLAGEGYRFVTLEGEYVGAEGVVKLGPLGKTTGLISRKSRLSQLEEAIANITAEIAETENRIEKDSQSKAHTEKLCKDLRTAVYEANTEKTQISSKLGMYEENIKRLAEEQPLIAGEMELLEAQIAQSVQREYDSKQKLDELETVNSQRQARIAELNARFEASKNQLRQRTDESTELKVSLGRMIEQNKSLKQSILSLESQMEGNRAAVEGARSEIRECAEQTQKSQRDILACEAAVSELYVEKERSQQSSTALHEKVKGLLAEQKRVEQLIRDKRAQESETDQQLNELRIELTQLEVKQQGLVERVREELQIELAQSYESYEQADVNWEQVREEIAELRGKLERLGNVNIDAIAEQEELEKRNEFLTAQVSDLNSSKGQLQQLINRLNKLSREKFQETFEQVRGHFQQIFRKLFGGGKADIMLEEAEDILEAGIEIIARPPGKETRSISLLSGGEKTMTAIALLFSVFKAKPSPFCLLDEVDAALDEANNERFNMIIREFQKDSQFIVITHSKRTMSMAEVLYGITMQTRGVSKKISVTFDQYGQQLEDAAVA